MFSNLSNFSARLCKSVDKRLSLPTEALAAVSGVWCGIICFFTASIFLGVIEGEWCVGEVVVLL